MAWCGPLGRGAACSTARRAARGEVPREQVVVLVVADVPGLAGLLVALVVDEAVEHGAQGTDRQVDRVDLGGLLGRGALLGGGGDQRVDREHRGGGAREKLLPAEGGAGGFVCRPLFELRGPKTRDCVSADLRLGASPGGSLSSALEIAPVDGKLLQGSADDADQLCEVAAVVRLFVGGVVVGRSARESRVIASVNAR